MFCAVHCLASARPSRILTQVGAKSHEHRSKAKQPRGLYCGYTRIHSRIPAAGGIDVLLAGIAIGGRARFSSRLPCRNYFDSSDRKGKTQEVVLDYGGASNTSAHRSIDRDILGCGAVCGDLVLPLRCPNRAVSQGLNARSPQRHKGAPSPQTGSLRPLCVLCASAVGRLFASFRVQQDEIMNWISLLLSTGSPRFSLLPAQLALPIDYHFLGSLL